MYIKLYKDIKIPQNSIKGGAVREERNGLNSKQTHYCSIYPGILYNIRPLWSTPVPTYWGQTLSICEDSTQGFDFDL